MRRPWQLRPTSIHLKASKRWPPKSNNGRAVSDRLRTLLQQLTRTIVMGENRGDSAMPESNLAGHSELSPGRQAAGQFTGISPETGTKGTVLRVCSILLARKFLKGAGIASGSRVGVPSAHYLDAQLRGVAPRNCQALGKPRVL